MRIVLINGSGHLFILLKISSPPISWSAIPQKGISGIGWGCALPLFPASNNKMLLFKFQFGKSPSTTYHYTTAGVWIHLLNNLTLDHFGWRLVNVLVNPSYNHDRINNLIEKLMIFKLYHNYHPRTTKRLRRHVDAIGRFSLPVIGSCPSPFIFHITNQPQKATNKKIRAPGQT